MVPTKKPAVTSPGWCLLSWIRLRPHNNAINTKPACSKNFRNRENPMLRRCWMYNWNVSWDKVVTEHNATTLTYRKIELISFILSLEYFISVCTCISWSKIRHFSRWPKNIDVTKLMHDFRRSANVRFWINSIFSGTWLETGSKCTFNIKYVYLK